MKKTLTYLLIAGILLFSLTGCGALLNDDKQLTGAELLEAYNNQTSSSGSGSSSSVNSRNATLTLTHIYKLTTSSGATTVWITFNPYSTTFAYLFPLTRVNSTTYSLMGDSNSSNNSYKKKITSPSSGYASFSTITQGDAYLLIKENSSNYNIDAYSNIIPDDDIITFTASSSSTSTTLQSRFTDYTYSSNNSSSLTSRPSNSSYTKSSTYKYLWVNLDNRIWVNLGNVYN